MSLKVFRTINKFRYLVVIVLVILNLAIIAQAWDEDDIIWAQGKSGTLNWGDKLENGNYTVEAYDFPRTDYKGNIGTRFVGIKLYENGILVKTESLGIFDNFIYDGEIRVTADELMQGADIHWQDDTYNPWANVRTELRGIPKLEVTINTNKDTYKLTDSKISATIKANNYGDSQLEDVELDVDIDGLKFHRYCTNKSTHYTYDIINKSETVTQNIEFEIPSHMKDTVYDISASIKGIDQKDEEHSFSGSKDITISNMIILTKTIDDSIFMKDNAFVHLTLRNYGSYGVKNIELTDTLNEYFELVGSTPLQWNFDIKAGETKDYKYTIRPINPDKDGYELNKAQAKWNVGGNTYNQSSNTPKIIVHGSKIILSKTVNPSKVDINQEVTVTVTATNNGDVRTNVKIFDNSPLPDNVVLVNGDTIIEKILKEDKSVSFTYIISGNTEGVYELPKAVAVFNDLQEYRGEEMSNSPTFTAGDPVVATESLRPGETAVSTPTQTPEPTDTDTRTQPGFGVAAGIIGVVIAIFYKRKSGR